MKKTSPKKNIVAKVFSIISTVILALCVVLLLYTTISYSKNGMVTFFNHSFHVIQTGSMEPEIKVGDVVVVKKVPYSEIQIGDDILFKCEDASLPIYGRYIVHRVVAFTETEGVYITRGINNPKDDKVPSKAEGKVVQINPPWSAVISFLTNWRSVIFVVGIGGIIIFTIFQIGAVVSNASKLKSEKDKEKLKNDEELKEQLKQEVLNEMKEEDKKETENFNNKNQKTKKKSKNLSDKET